MEDYIQRNNAMAMSAKSAKNKRKQLERIQLMDKPLQDLKRTQLSFSIEKSSHKEVLQVKDLSIYIDAGNNRRPLLKNINFQLDRGEKLALIRSNDIGKSTLLKTLLGVYTLESGTIN
ncbi:ATP-binding cassette domain-containing protein [Peribacillus simplex]|uniref:ATP-binding cassette domain-containing protein n=1 Tax=Peribacillus simplex TaxID=1478 RepID=UPI0011DE00A2|nr:ATP-binding cassette domain-containing protein [Peribacillus simplex]